MLLNSYLSLCMFGLSCQEIATCCLLNNSKCLKVMVINSFIEILNIVLSFVCDSCDFVWIMNLVIWDLLLYSLIKHKMKGHREGSLIIWIIGPLYHIIWETEWSDFILLSDMCQCEAQYYPSCLIKGKSINLSEIVSKNAIIGIRH